MTVYRKTMRIILLCILTILLTSNLSGISSNAINRLKNGYLGVQSYLVNINNSLQTITDYEKRDNAFNLSEANYPIRQKNLMIEPNTGSQADINKCKPDNVIRSVFSDEYSLRGHVTLIESRKEGNKSYAVCKYDFSSHKFIGKITDCLSQLYKRYDHYLIANKIARSVSYERYMNKQYNEAVGYEIRSAVLKNINYRIKDHDEYQPPSDESNLEVEFLSGLDEFEGISIFDRIISMRISLEKYTQKLRETCLLAHLSDEGWFSYFKHISNH